MRVFVLCTGRCGSTTFAYACQHMRNFTVGHESRAKFIGRERLEYPDNHIEIDNRLSWLLGRLEEVYGDGAYYVHLTRNVREVAASYARRMDNPASIGAAHKRSILMNSPQDDLEVCMDVVETMRANIEHFLLDKSNVMHVALENTEEDFASFWDWIGANGDKEAALAEWKTFYNDSEGAHGAIRPPVPETELAELREKHCALVTTNKRLQQALEEATEKFEHAEQLRRDLEGRYRKLEKEQAKLQAAWLDEAQGLRDELSDRDRIIGELQNSLDTLRTSNRQAAAVAEEIARERDAFVAYADELEARFLNVLRSRTWKILGPYRFATRKAKELLFGVPQPPNSLPERPKLTVKGKWRSARLTFKSGGKRISRVTRLDERLWSGFSRTALKELQKFEESEQESLRDRSEAAYCLARWYSAQGDFDRALSEIRNMRSLRPECAEEPRQYLPEALFLCRLGKAVEARARLGAAGQEFDPTAQLMLANTWNPAVAGVSEPEAEVKALSHLNAIYERFGVVPVEKRDPDKPLSIDNLRGDRREEGQFDRDGKVTVIVPVFNAEDTILTALTSIAEQTWQNLEVLVVDDASTDSSTEIIEEFCASDSRFRLIRQSQNGGSYLCRNRALREATGAFVTIHDSDDWSHPDKIRCQVEDLKERPGPYNLAMWVRTTSSLSFFGNSRTLHNLVRPDHSSGLFPRETFQRYGAWDAIRISADTELYWRIESALGNKKWMFNRRQVLKGCPLSFGRMSDTSLTQAGPTSVMTIYHGVRREYRDAADFWHSRQRCFNDQTPWTRRKSFFPVPALLDSTESSGTKLSALLIADWNSADNLIEAVMGLARSARESNNACLGLLHYPEYDSDITAALRQDVRGFAWDNDIRIIAPGETLDVDIVFAMTPTVFEHPMDRFPTVTYERLVVLTSSGLRVSTEKLECVRRNLIEFFDHPGDWEESLEACLQIIDEYSRSDVPDQHIASPSASAGTGLK